MAMYGENQTSKRGKANGMKKSPLEQTIMMQAFDQIDANQGNQKKIYTNFGRSDFDQVEMHVYGGKTLIDSDYAVNTWFQNFHPNCPEPHIKLDIHEDIRELGYINGEFNLQYNFYRNILGGSDKKFYIHAISPSREEIVITTSIDEERDKAKLFGRQSFHEVGASSQFFPDAMLNLQDNRFVIIKGWRTHSKGVALKLYKPLPKNIAQRDSCWVVRKMIEPIEFKIRLIKQVVEAVGGEIRGPNFEVQIQGGDIGETDFQSWDDILGTNSTNKQDLLNKFVSSSLDSAELNIDYGNYFDFVHFSSALERLKNFKYKMQLLEHYSSSIATLEDISPGQQTTYSNNNIQNFRTKINEVKNGFSGYEKHLYYASSSYYTSSTGIVHQTTWPKTNAIQPYTQSTVGSTEAVAWFASQSNVALDYDVKNPNNLENTIPFHVREDEDNSNYLLFVNMVSEHFDDVYTYASKSLQITSRVNPLYEGLSKDIVYNVLASFGWESYQGFHFTDLWEYALGVNADGIYGQTTSSNTLVNVSRSIAGGGWIATSESQVHTRYATPQQRQAIYTRDDVSKETWKRMLNNLPYLLKTKGSERGIKALITTYGLPPTLLRVFEYGGPRKVRKTDSYVKYDKFSYSLEFDGINSHVQIPWGKINAASHPNGGSTARTPDAWEVRFNTWTAETQSLCIMAGTEIGGTPRMSVMLKPHPLASTKTSGKYNFGKLVISDKGAGTFASASTDYMPIYDNDWWNVMVSRTTASYGGAQTLKLSVAKSADHSNARMTHTSSVKIVLADEDNTWNRDNYFLLGQGTSSAQAGDDEYFSGSMQEFRTWALPYGDQFALDRWNELGPFYNHARDPLSIEGYGATGSYAQVVQRYSMGADLNRYSSSWAANTNISSSAPSSKKLLNPWSTTTFTSTVASASLFSGSITTDWPTEEERFYTAMPDLIGTREISDKTRIESAELIGRLDNRTKVERSQFDKAPLDSNRVGVYYAPHFEIDLDIARELGGASFDNYVGNPLDVRDDEYKRLRMLRNHYWYKHDNPYDFHEYLKILKHLDHTLFRQIEMLIPARCNAQVGLLVKPNMLERPKVKQMFANKDENHYEGTIDTSIVKIRATTTTLGGPYYRGERNTERWKTPEGLNEELDALQAHTGFQTYVSKSGAGVDTTFVTDQSEGAVVAEIDTRMTYGGHNLEDAGARYIWRNMHQWKWTHPSSGSYVKGNWYFTDDAWFQQGGASYENAMEFLAGDWDGNGAQKFHGFQNIFATQSVGTGPNGGTINPSIAFKGSHNRLALNNVPRFNGRHDSSFMSQEKRQRVKFTDFGNIKNYHHQRMSRIYYTKKYWYLSPKNNMRNSGSTGGHHQPAVSMSGWSPAELANGFYRSGIRPVSSSYQRAEVQDFRPTAMSNLFHGGCKLVGSDFNMPVLATVDGGPVVEIVDTNPNQLTITGRTAAGGDISATGETMTRAL